MEAATTPPEAETPAEEQPVEEQSVPYERFKQANTKAKEAAQKATKLEQEMADLRAEIEQHKNAGLPELEVMKRELEKITKRAEAAEQAKAEADALIARGQKERLVTAAASEANFDDPSDALAFINLDEIEDEKDAERAVKRLASKKPRLLKNDEKPLPGKVLADGRKAEAVTPTSGIDVNAEAESLREALSQFRNQWQTLGG